MYLFKTKKLIIFFLFLSFIAGFLYRHSRPSYLYYFKNQVEKLILPQYTTPEKFTNLCPKKIKNLPKNSVLIIGHAYGSPIKSDLRGNKKISPKVYEFYLKNKKNIDAIIFSGDVLKDPSTKKWNDFYSDFDNNLRIYIAPGNHDVDVNYDDARRDIFNMIVQNKQNQKQYPFKIELNESLFIIVDSNAKENPLKQILSIVEKEKSKKNIYIVSHHVLTKGLSFAANNSKHFHLTNDSFFKNKFKIKNGNNVTFFYGDGGVEKSKPRFACLKLSNSFHLLSGIGEIQGDTIFAISNNIIYRMEI